jgi:hypothetical protein
MITNIWLKSQPKKKLSYPDCLPKIYTGAGYNRVIVINPASIKNEAAYDLNTVSRIEFRP